MTKLIEIFVRIISEQIDVIKENVSNGDNCLEIQLVAEEGEVLLTLFLSDDEIKYSLITAVARCLPDYKVYEISINADRDIISFCLI